MSELIGMRDIRQTVARLRLAMETVRHDGLTYSDRLHSILIGSAGTGKTRLVRVLAELCHEFGVTKSPVPIIHDAVDFADFSKDFQINFKKAKGHVLCIENVQKLIPAGYAKNVEQIDRLISEMSKPANKLDPIVVLSGQPQGLREFLSANDVVSSKFPYVFKLPDFTSSELAELTEAELRSSGFAVSDAARDKLVKVFKLVLKNSRRPGFEPEGRNAWAALRMAETLKLNYFADSPKDRSGTRTISEGEILNATEEEKSVEQILADLDKFVGMHALKKAVRNLVDQIGVQKRRAQAGIGREEAIAFHVVLTGSPGTGKTSVARVLGQTLRAIGVLELGHVIEADRGKMVAQHVGGTAPQVNDLCDRALGGVLFIDEAYTLKQGDSDSFGQEAIDTLLKRLEDDRGKFVVIIAGYPNEIRLLLNSNPGLHSRFNERYRFHLDDYSPDELLTIFQRLAADASYSLDPDAERLARKHFVLRCALKDKNFGNAREARDLFDACRSLQSQRLASKLSEAPSDQEDLTCIRGVDIPTVGQQITDIKTVIDEFSKLIGLSTVKSELRALINYIQTEKLRSERGGKETPLNLHFVFRGGPGTGKTTVARILANAFKSLGLLPKGNLKEVDRSGLVGKYLGDTSLKVQAAVDEAMGGVLFIDEAYSLLGDSYGTEAINALLKRMEDDRGKFVVIAAGYHREMEEFLDSNTGLRSRFTKFIDFDDYVPNELTAIYLDLVERKGMVLDPAALALVARLFEDIYANRDANFANGRAVRNIFEKTLQNQAERISPLVTAGEVELTALNTLVTEDLPA
ncbi:MAG: AAA family ATPase [Panacagrimonas sp.]